MANFIGEHTCKLDAKGRLLFPAALKKQLEPGVERFVVKKDLFENCLVLYTMSEWELQNKVIRQKLNPFNKEHNRFLRGFFKGTAELMLDAGGRLLVPKRLLDLIGANKQLVVSGQDAKIEIWALDVYEGMAEDEGEFAALAESIMQDSTNPEE